MYFIYLDSESRLITFDEARNIAQPIKLELCIRMARERRLYFFIGWRHEGTRQVGEVSAFLF
jgi:tRNA threonylcarbamoyladenosine modification (KEOPS) complex Cgi121 subunit